ncbi:MAG: HEPN domain-containing protein [Deltaproteobacteria bacterium]|nr:HEPN domain-containing protein [Deltaproteobacteria bacterium]
MPAIDRDILAKVRQWMQYGDDDLLLAKHGLNLASSAPYRLIAYHAQQCGEKYLKAFLVLHTIDFPFTHNLSRLIELAQQITLFPDALWEAEILTPYAITARYPGEDEPVTAKEANQAINIAEQTRQLILQALAEKGIV